MAAIFPLRTMTFQSVRSPWVNIETKWPLCNATTSGYLDWNDSKSASWRRKRWKVSWSWNGPMGTEPKQWSRQGPPWIEETWQGEGGESKQSCFTYPSNSEQRAACWTDVSQSQAFHASVPLIYLIFITVTFPCVHALKTSGTGTEVCSATKRMVSASAKSTLIPHLMIVRGPIRIVLGPRLP